MSLSSVKVVGLVNIFGYLIIILVSQYLSLRLIYFIQIYGVQLPSLRNEIIDTIMC